MNDLLWKRHGIQQRSDQRKHLHAYVDAAVLDKVDEMVLETILEVPNL